MKYFFGVVLVFVVIYMLYIPVAYLGYARAEDSEFSELLLSKAVDYAGEAAMAACIELNDLDMNYIESDNVLMTPINAIDSFASLICLSYGLPQSDFNKNSIINSIPAMILAAYDGYYIAEWQESENGEQSLMWKPKRAYVIDSDTDNPDKGTLYNVSLSSDDWYSVNKQTLAVTNGTGALPYSREEIIQHINRVVNRDITTVLARYSLENNKQSMQSFYLPFSADTYGVNRIEKPCLIVIMQDVDIDGVRPLNVSTVNGMKVSQKRVVIGWTDGSGYKYYCYSGKADSTAQGWIIQNGVMFDTIQDAALAGYLPYIK